MQTERYLIRLEDKSDIHKFEPIMILGEDEYEDNCFCVLRTKEGNIAFSYYDFGISPNFIVENNILFLSFGKSYYVVDIIEREILHQSINGVLIIYEIVKCDSMKCILFIGELLLICFGLAGNVMWKNQYRNWISDWKLMDKEISVTFDNEERWTVFLENGSWKK